MFLLCLLCKSDIHILNYLKNKNKLYCCIAATLWLMFTDCKTHWMMIVNVEHLSQSQCIYFNGVGGGYNTLLLGILIAWRIEFVMECAIQFVRLRHMSFVPILHNNFMILSISYKIFKCADSFLTSFIFSSSCASENILFSGRPTGVVPHCGIICCARAHTTQAPSWISTIHSLI